MFSGIAQEHFDTYSKEKWSSMVHNLARMKSKDLMLALCEHSQQGLESELEGLQKSSSDEIPNITNQKKVDCQWVYWFRDKKERENLKSFLEKTPLNQNDIFTIAPQDKHITLAVILRQQELWVGIRIPTGGSIDRKNLAAKLQKSWEREKFAELIQDIPKGAQVKLSENEVSLEEVSIDFLATQSTTIEKNSAAWSIGVGIPAHDALDLGADLSDLVRRWLGALLPIYRFAAWSRENDFIEATKKIQQEKAQKRNQTRNFQTGHKVRVTSGLFAGKVGIIQSIDSKGKSKVKVGKMSVVVPGDELIPTK